MMNFILGAVFMMALFLCLFLGALIGYRMKPKSREPDTKEERLMEDLRKVCAYNLSQALERRLK